MALKLVAFTLVVTIFKVQSQSIGCASNQQSSTSNNQPSCGYGQQISGNQPTSGYGQQVSGNQPSSGYGQQISGIQPSSGYGQQISGIQLQPSNTNKVLKAAPQLQIVPGQNCNLQAIPLSQLSQFLSQQRPQTGCGCASPRQGGQEIQVTSIPQIPSQTAQCAQPVQPVQTCGCNPTVITAPVSTITIPPSSCATVIDNSITNTLANAIEMMIANELINTAVCNNMINQDCLPIPVVETSVSGFDLSNFIKTLNSNQMGSCQTVPTTSSYSCSRSDEPTCYDWERLLERLQGSNCGPTPSSDWSAVMDYLNSQGDSQRCEVPTIEIEPASSCYDYSSFIDYLKQKGMTASQISDQRPIQNCGQSCGQTQNYNLQQGVYVPSRQCDIDSGVLEALAAYLGVNPSEVCSNTYPNAAEVVFPEEIPAQLVCNYGYMPTTVPVVSFSVQPIGDCSSNFIVGTKCQ